MIATLSNIIGGPFGRHAVDPPNRRFWIPIRTIMLSAIIMFGVAWLQKMPCASGAWVDHMQYTQFCYSDIRALWGAEHLDQGAIPYFDHPVEYPVLTGVFMGIIGLPVYYLLGAAGGAAYWHISAIVLAILGITAVGALYQVRRLRGWDAMMLAVAPAMLFTAFVNWDLLPLALLMFFFVAWSRKHTVWAGILLGLAIGAKFYPLLIIGPLLVLAYRYRRYRGALTTSAVAAATWLVVNLPFILWARTGWLRFFELNSERPIDWGTLWYVLRHFGTDESGIRPAWAEPGFVNVGYLVLFVLCCGGIALLGLFAKVPPRFAQLAFLVVATFLIVGKVWSQQYVLWLIPLAILARPKWRAFLVWQIAELCYFFAFYGELLRASGDDGIPEWVFVAASMGRLSTVIGLCVLVIIDILRPEQDIVRMTYQGDPDAAALVATK